MVEVVVEKKAKMSMQQSIVWLVVCTPEPHIECVLMSKFSFFFAPFFPFSYDYELLGLLLSNQTLAACDVKH